MTLGEHTQTSTRTWQSQGKEVAERDFCVSTKPITRPTYNGLIVAFGFSTTHHTCSRIPKGLLASDLLRMLFAITQQSFRNNLGSKQSFVTQLCFGVLNVLNDSMLSVDNTRSLLVRAEDNRPKRTTIKVADPIEILCFRLTCLGHPTNTNVRVLINDVDRNPIYLSQQPTSRQLRTAKPLS